MTHLYIELNTGLTEEVSSSIISKLYELAISGDLDETSDLKGRLHTPSGYAHEIEYLTTAYTDLHINADKLYIKFEDDIIQNKLSNYVGDGYGVATLDTSSFTGKFGAAFYNQYSHQQNSISAADSEWKLIESFDEFYYFNATSIANLLFSNCTRLTSIRLPNTITSLDVYAFNGCTKLESINLNNITSLGVLCFRDCKKLNNITINSELTSIPERCFLNDESLTECNLTNVTNIGTSAFDGCTNLQSITSILNVTSIGLDAFRKCANVQEFESLNLPNLQTLSTGSNGTFAECTQIKHVVDLGTIPSIGAKWDGTFGKCTNLEDVILPESVTTIEYRGFNNCTKLKYIKILSTSVPTYTLKDGFGQTKTFGTFFGESYQNGNPVTDTYTGLTFPIYVVDSLLSQYQAADGWKYVGPGRLRPLSQFATDFPNG